MKWIGLAALWLLIQVFRLLPFWLIYRISDGMAWMMYRVFGYRKKVIFENLERAFPEKSTIEREKIARQAYRNLCDVTLETFKAFGMSARSLEKRNPCINPELVNEYLARGQTVIICGSHYNNWEWACITLPLSLKAEKFCVYKPLSNHLIDRYLNRQRGKTGMRMIAMEDVFAAMRRHRKEIGSWWLLSDQSPSSRKNAHWVSFLGQDTATLPGLDFLARKLNMPVIYFHVARVRRGRYEVEYQELWPDPESAEEMDITLAYSRHIERIIRTEPGNWLWSHKRWKMTRM